MASSTSAITSQRMLFDYGELRGPDIKRCESAVERIDKLQRRMACDVIAIGGELLAVKERLEHGQFGNWIKHYFGWSHMTAHRMMQVAEVLGDKFNNLLSIDTSALYLLASDKCPDELREDMLARAEKGERITHATVRSELEGDDKGEPSYEDRIDRVIAKIRTLAACEQRCILLARLRILCEELEEDE